MAQPGISYDKIPCRPSFIMWWLSATIQGDRSWSTLSQPVGTKPLPEPKLTNQQWSLYQSGPWFNIKMSSYQYRKSHFGDKTVVRSSYLHSGISYTGKITSVYWFSPLGVILHDVRVTLSRTWVLWCLKTLVHQPFVQQIAQSNNKENIRGLHYWLFVRRIHWYILPHKAH